MNNGRTITTNNNNNTTHPIVMIRVLQYQSIIMTKQFRNKNNLMS